MSLTDLLRMSIGNLKRRKLRTFLTVLGVIIGTASIVVMISLGLGLQQSMYDELEQSGGLTMLTVTGQGAGESMYYYSDRDEEESTKYITDETIQDFAGVEHVTMAAPVYSMSAYALKGRYMTYLNVEATTPEALAAQNIPIKEGGSLPQSGGNKLEFVYGNGVIQQFYDKNTNEGYWETGELPDIDIEKDTLFLILDTEAYDQARYGYIDESGNAGKPRSAKKTLVQASGVVEGDPDTYTPFYYSAYCDITTLKSLLRKEFAGRVIPGQPSTKTGKPYNFFAYSSAKVKVDDLDNVEEVSQSLRSMGYNVQSNVEFLESMQRELVVVEAVLGGIGAVSLLVAAIGIANTMMMSIYERTKEIGVFKVLGCRLKNIRQMFLMEAGFIGLLGGIVGNILSFLLSAVINFLFAGAADSMGLGGGISYIPLWLSALSIGFAILVGMMAGYFPALRAMRLSPLEAIRNQ
ncbi:MAG: ABC transporter permease [Coprococcus sp.]|nr:ABC transporter permease [Coprococcus sp.]